LAICFFFFGGGGGGLGGGGGSVADGSGLRGNGEVRAV
jgi:hypothetical protein